MSYSTEIQTWAGKDFDHYLQGYTRGEKWAQRGFRCAFLEKRRDSLKPFSRGFLDGWCDQMAESANPPEAA